MKFLAGLVGIIAVAYVGLCVYLMSMQRSMLYMPTANAIGGDTIEIDTGPAMVSVQKVGDGEHAILYFGGNAEDVSANADEFADTFPAYTVYLFNYRGYGGSSGEPTESGIYHDALAVYDKLAEEHFKVSVMGRSLGSAVATFVASTREPAQLVLVTPFDSVVSMAKSVYWMFPVSVILQDRYDSIGRAKRIRCPTLVIIAEADEVIPRRHTDQLVDAMDPALLEIEVISAAGHNTLHMSHQYQEALMAFLP